MKKLTALLFLTIILSSSAPLHAEYDPQHTMLALNMAIVSVNRILRTEDRAVLDWEYENIINRLAIGNIESDPEIKDLYDELLGFINGKRLRQSDRLKLKEFHSLREQEAYYRAMSQGFQQVKAPENDTLWGWIASMAVSAASSVSTGYYEYQASKQELHRQIQSDEWQLTRQELEACNKLQSTLLNSSWSLLSKYHLPNDYRLTQENIREFLAVMDEQNHSKRLGRLKFIERKFKVYPPYWFFRADAAFNAGDSQECSKSYAKFNEVWRPVLNYDPYKLEAVKYRIRELAEKGVPEGETANELRVLVETVRDYAPPSDWGSNLFAGIVYFALGNKEEAVNCIEYGNVDSGRETEISGVILAQMKQGKIDVASLPDELRVLHINLLSFEDLKKLAERGNAEAQLHLGNMYYNDYGVNRNYAEAVRWYHNAAEQGNAEAQYRLGVMYYYGRGVKENDAEAVKWFSKSAEQGNAEAQDRLGFMYRFGYGVKEDDAEALKWYRKSAEQGYAGAQYSMGNMYEYGKGVARNLQEARQWYGKAAAQGNTAALHALARLGR